MTRVFVSHSNLDDEPAGKLKSWLGPQGFEFNFLDFDKHSEVGGDQLWEQHLYREIERSDALVVILTRNWLASKWCFAEFTQARTLGKPIFAVIEASDADTVIAPDIQHIDLTQDREAGLRTLSDGLTSVAGSAQGQFSWDPNRPPYPGLKAFAQEDAAVYCGRDGELRDVIERLNARRVQGGRRLLALIGGSAAGKSSFLDAGLVPRIQRDRSNWIALPSFRPGANPIDEMSGAIAQALGDDTEAKAVRDRFDAKEFSLAFRMIVDELRAKRSSFSAYVLVSIDQAEDLFAASPPEETERFLAGLDSLLEDDMPVLAVMAIKADAMSGLQKAGQLTHGFDQLYLEPMPPARIQQIIDGPARVAGVQVEAALVDRIKQDSAIEDALPLVAFALRELYDRSGGSHGLTLKDYEALGDADSHLSVLQNVPRRVTDDVLRDANASDNNLKALRNSFAHAMALAEPGGTFVSRPARWDRLPAAAHGLLEKLGQAGLLTIRGEGDAKTVELTHDVLLRVWPQLAVWLEEERDFHVVKNQLERDVAEWRQASSPEEKDAALLPRRKLNAAGEWLRLYPEQLTDDEKGFIAASVDREHVRERGRMRARLKSEWRRMVTRVAVAGFAVALGLGGFVSWQWFEARQAQRLSGTEQQAASATRKAAEAELQAAVKEREAAAAARAEMEKARASADTATETAEARATAEIEKARSAAAAQVEKAQTTAKAQIEEALASAKAQVEEMRATAAAEVEKARTEAKTLAEETKAAAKAEIAEAKASIVTTVEDAEATVMAEKSKSAEEVERAARETQAALEVRVRHLTGLAARELDDGDTVTATLLGLEAVSDAAGGASASVAESGLFRAATSLPEEIVEIDGRDGDGVSSQFSPDGSRLLTVGRNRSSVRLWDLGSTGAPQVISDVRGQPITAAAFSPDGKRVITASSGGVAHVWDAQTGSRLLTLQGHTSALSDVVFSGDGARIATASLNGSVRVWDARTGAVLAIFDNVDGEVDLPRSAASNSSHKSATEKPAKVSFAADNLHVLTVSDIVTVWNIKSGESVQTLKAEGYYAYFDSAAISPDGTRVAAETRVGPEGVLYTTGYGPQTRIQSWNVETGEMVSDNGVAAPARDPKGSIDPDVLDVPVLNIASAVTRASLSPDGRKLIAPHADGSAQIWDTQAGATIGILRAQGTVRAARFSPDGRRIVTISSEPNVLEVWDARTLDVIGVLRAKGSGIVEAVLSPDGFHIAVTYDDDAIRVWRIGQPWQTSIAPEPSQPPFDAVLSPDGSRVLAISKHGVAQLYEAATGELVTTIGRSGAPVTRADFSPDGQTIVLASGTAARVWDVRANRTLTVFREHASPITSVRFSKDGRSVVSVGADTVMYVWDARTSERQSTANLGSRYRTASISGDGTRFVGVSSESSSKADLWDVADRQKLAELATSAFWRNFAALAEGGRLVGDLSSDGSLGVLRAANTKTLSVWNAASGAPLNKLTGHDSAVRGVSISPNGERILTASEDGTARLWSAKTGREIVVYRGHAGYVNSVSFSADGAHAATTSDDGTIKVWPTFQSVDDLVGHARKTVERCLTPQERRNYFLAPEPPGWCIEMKKQPYDSARWRQWLADKSAGKAPPLPE